MQRLLLFDVDGTLCSSGKILDDRFIEIFEKLSRTYKIGILGGGTMDKITKQLDKVKDYISYWFAENGVISKYGSNDIIVRDNIVNHVGSNKIKQICNYLNSLEYSAKGKNCVDVRDGLLYYAILGLNPTDKERSELVKMDIDGKYRIEIIKFLEQQPLLSDLKISLGGQTGLSISPWEKDYVSTYFDLSMYHTVSFFGDKIFKYGSDYSMTTVKGVDCYPVKNIDDTYDLLCYKFLA